MLRTDALFAVEPLFLLVMAGAVVGITIQAIIVVGLVCSMLSAIWPHHPDSWLHRKMHDSLVWFGGRGGAHARALG
jgi:hypothetical protein